MLDPPFKCISDADNVGHYCSLDIVQGIIHLLAFVSPLLYCFIASASLFCAIGNAHQFTPSEMIVM